MSSPWRVLLGMMATLVVVALSVWWFEPAASLERTVVVDESTAVPAESESDTGEGPRLAGEAEVAPGGEVEQTPVDSGTEESALKAATFTGRIVDKQAEPIAGVEIWYVPSRATLVELGHDEATEDVPRDLMTRTESGSDGVFSIEARHLPAEGGDRWPQVPELVVSHPEFVTAGHSCSGYEEGGYDAGDIALVRGGAVAGKIVGESYEPVKGARVEVWEVFTIAPVLGDGWPRSERSFTSGLSEESGRFTVGGLWPGLVNLRISAKNRRPHEVRGLIIEAGGRLDLGMVVLATGGVIAGKVVGEYGGPLAGARVVVATWRLEQDYGSYADTIYYELKQANRHAVGGKVLTGQNGRFRFAELAEVPHSLYVSHAGLEPVRMSDVIPDATEIVVKLVEEATIAVIAKDRATRERLALDDGTAWRKTTEPDLTRRLWPREVLRPVRVLKGRDVEMASGGLRVVGVGPGGSLLDLSAPGYARERISLKGLLAPDEGERSWLLTPEAVLGGTVRAPDGTPVSRATVTIRPYKNLPGDEQGLASPRQMVTNEQGEYFITRLQAARYDLWARAAGFARSNSHWLDILPEMRITKLELVLRASGSFRGVVLSPREEPVPGVRVTARHISDRLSREVFRDVTATDGTFILADLPAGGYSLEADPGGYAEAVLEAGRETDVVVRLRDRPAVEGRVIHASGTVAWARIIAYASGESAANRFTTYSDVWGEFRLELPDKGQYLVAARTGEGAFSPFVEVWLDWDETWPHDFLLGEASVGGTVTRRASGEVVADAVVTLELSDRLAQRTVISDRDGRFRFGEVARGDYFVSAAAEGLPGRQVGPLRVDGFVGVEGLVLDLTPLAVLTGTVRDWDGSLGDEQTALLVEAESGIWVDSTPLKEERFRFEGLEEGTYDVMVVSSSMLSWFRDDRDRLRTLIRVFGAGVRKVSLTNGSTTHVEILRGGHRR